MGRIYNKVRKPVAKKRESECPSHRWKKEQFDQRKCPICGATKRLKRKKKRANDNKEG